MPIDWTASEVYFTGVHSLFLFAFHFALLLNVSVLSVNAVTKSATETTIPTQHSVVKVITFSQEPYWDAPWRFQQVSQAGGSGFVVSGNRILTNAHVVSWAKQIIVKRYQDPKSYLAAVEFIGHDCDLALLKVYDSEFFNGLQALSLGSLPSVQSSVTTCGYPAGGEQISYTRGVVSRIEMSAYSHAGNRSFLIAQTDAAINPGNSGGPVIQDGKAVGVAFQGISGLENTGFFIPTPIVAHFLKDIQDGVYNGFPVAGLRLEGLENPAYRKFLGMDSISGGTRVDGSLPFTSIKSGLETNDVILKIRSIPVSNDGTILYEGNRVHCGLLFDEAQVGDTLSLEVWRRGAKKIVPVPMISYTADLAQGNQYDTLPKYLIHGGLVFLSLSRDYLKTLGRNWAVSSPPDFMYALQYQPYQNPDEAIEEPIVLASILPHPVNANWVVKAPALLTKVNGIKINSFATLDSILTKSNSDKAGSSDTGSDLFEFEGSKLLEAMDRGQVKQAMPVILSNYGIPAARRLR